MQLENVIEKQELQAAKVVDCQKLTAYRDRKMDDLEKLKSNYTVLWYGILFNQFILFYQNILLSKIFILSKSTVAFQCN